MQSSFSDVGYAAKKKQMRRDRFLAEVEGVTPWSALEGEIEPFYPEGAGRGRRPIGLARMLRMYVGQQCFGLSDEGIGDAIYDSRAVRGFVGIDVARDAAPDAITLLKFRRLLETLGLTGKIFEVIQAHLAGKGLMMFEGTIVDATLIAAPPSTRNRAKARDSEMPQTKKGNQWYFGMKAHIGVDFESGLVHAVVATAANVTDVTSKLLHGDETEVLGDAGYQCVEKREDDTKVTWHMAMKRAKRKAPRPDNRLGKLLEKLERAKASLRAKVEHPFHVVKNVFKHRKTRYRDLAKNEAQLFTLFGNLLLVRRPLLALRAQGPS